MIRDKSPKLSLNRAIKLTGLTKSTWYYQKKKSKQDKYKQVKKDLLKVIKDNSAYGYRRATPELREIYQHEVNHKVVQNLMRELEIQVVKGFKAPKSSAIRKLINKAGTRVNLILELEDIKPLQVAVTDFTEISYDNGRKKAHLMPIVDLVSKLVLGWAVGETQNTELALEAWIKAKRMIKKFRRIKNLIVHHDQGAIYTGYVWLKQLVIDDKIKISYALRGFKDNEKMESWNSRFKNENRSLILDCETLKELKKTIRRQIIYHNAKRRHSSIGNQAPLKFLVENQKNQAKIKKLS